MNRREFLVSAAALPGVLRWAPELLAATSTNALVTADTESHVAVVNLATGRVLRRIRTLAGPRSIEAAGPAAVVAHTAVGAVTLLDRRSLAIRQVLHGFEEPRYTAASPDGRHAFVTDSGRRDLATIDVLGGRVLGRLRLGGWPRHLSLDPTGRLLWIALGTEARVIAVVDVADPARPRLLARIRPPFLAHDIGFEPAGKRVWVTSADRRALAVYDARSARPVLRLTADAPPQHVAFIAGSAYVTSGDSATLRVHALWDGRARRTTSLPGGSYNVQQGGGRVLTPSLDHGTLSVLDRSGRLLRRIEVAASSHDACFA